MAIQPKFIMTDMYTNTVNPRCMFMKGIKDNMRNLYQVSHVRCNIIFDPVPTFIHLHTL